MFFFVCVVGPELSKYYSLKLNLWVWLFIVIIFFYLLCRAFYVLFEEILQTPFFKKAELYPRLYTTIVPYVFVILFALSSSFFILRLISSSITDVEAGSFAGVSLIKHHGESLEWYIFATDAYLESQNLSHVFMFEGEPLERIVEKLYIESGGDLQIFQDLLRAKIHGTRLWFWGHQLGWWTPLGLGPWSDLRNHLFFSVTWSPGRGFEHRFVVLTTLGRFARYLLFGYY